VTHHLDEVLNWRYFGLWLVFPVFVIAQSLLILKIFKHA